MRRQLSTQCIDKQKQTKKVTRNCISLRLGADDNNNRHSLIARHAHTFKYFGIR